MNVVESRVLSYDETTEILQASYLSKTTDGFSESYRERRITRIPRPRVTEHRGLARIHRMIDQGGN